MTTGFLGQSCLYEASAGFSPVILDNRERISTNPKATSKLVSGWLDGAKTINQPVVTYTKSTAGKRAGSFLLDFYYRTHISPSVVAFGNILSNQQRTVELWNAWFDENYLSVINEVGTDGLILESSQDPPIFLGALESKVYTLKALTAGLPTINASYTFVTSLDDIDPVLKVTGLRVLAFWPAANWGEKIVERLEWLTDVMSSKNQKEQRVKLRQKPRRQLEFSCIVAGNRDRRLFENLLFSWQSRLFGLPIWTDQQILSEDTPAGALSIPCTTATRDYEAGSLVGIFLGSEHEISTILSVNSDSVDLSAPTTKNWKRGAKVVPVRTARLTDSQPLVRETDSVLTFRVQFKVEAPDFIPAKIETATYRGYDVLESATNWREQITAEYKRDIAVIDFNVGVTVYDDLTDNPTVFSKYYWQANGRQDLDTLKKFLFARYGKLKPIWLPTLMSDMTVIQDVSSSSQVLYVQNDGYTRSINAQVQRRDLRIKLKNGNIYYKRINQAFEDSPSIERVILDTPFGVAINANMFERVSFMALSRLDADSLEMTWETNETIETEAVFRSVRDDV